MNVKISLKFCIVYRYWKTQIQTSWKCCAYLLPTKNWSIWPFFKSRKQKPIQILCLRWPNQLSSGAMRIYIDETCVCIRRILPSILRLHWNLCINSMLFEFLLKIKLIRSLGLIQHEPARNLLTFACWDLHSCLPNKIVILWTKRQDLMGGGVGERMEWRGFWDKKRQGYRLTESIAWSKDTNETYLGAEVLALVLVEMWVLGVLGGDVLWVVPLVCIFQLKNEVKKCWYNCVCSLVCTVLLISKSVSPYSAI